VLNFDERGNPEKPENPQGHEREEVQHMKQTQFTYDMSWD